MITINWKTYKPTNAWHFSVQAILNDLIEKDCLEEVKENKETLGEICNLDTKPSDFSDYAHSQYNTSILEKLRVWIQKLLDEDRSYFQEYNDEFATKVLQLLTSLETPPISVSCSGDSSSTWDYYQETKEEQEAKAWQDLNKKQDAEFNGQPQFTPWQEIEVSNDGEKWEKRTFQNMIKEKFQCWQTEEEHNKTTMFLKLWQFARPLEQVTIPEFDYDKIHMEAMKDHVGSFATHVAHPLCKQMSEITHFLHSQFPNSKPK